MRSITLMQPYFFPYIGYFQLINSVDSFVIYDDVQYMKGGWINRNRILLDGKPCYITLPLAKGHVGDNINQRFFSADFERGKQKICGQLRSAYMKAPYFSKTMQLVEQVFACEERNVAGFLVSCLKKVCDYIGIETTFLISSEMPKQKIILAGQDRVIAICKTLETELYINPIGGMGLYSTTEFANNGIALKFLKCMAEPYRQFSNEFVPDLSIIDVLVFNTSEEILEKLEQFELFEK